MKTRNIAALAIVTHNNTGIKSSYPFSILLVQRSNGESMLSLPFTEYDGKDTDLKTCLSRYIKEHISFPKDLVLSDSEMILVQTYCVRNEANDSVDIITAYMITVDGMPIPSRVEGQSDIITALWMNIETMGSQRMEGNHNQILEDIKGRLVDLAISPINKSDVINKTPKAIIDNYFDEDKRRIWINRLFSYGFNIYEHAHPEVAVDVVLIGYRDTEAERGLSVLLTKRTYGELGANRWALPSTFLTIPKDSSDFESQLIAAKRALDEKTGIDSTNLSFYPLKPFSHPSRMRGKKEEGVSVISLPLVAIVKYEDINPKQIVTERTSGCRWFPIDRTLYTKQGIDGILIRDAVKAYHKNPGANGKRDYKDTEEFKGRLSIRLDGDKLLSPDEIGIPAADVYVDGNKLICNYYQEPDRSVLPIQDTETENVERLYADHANIILEALQALKERSHFDTFPAKLIPEDGFEPMVFQKRWEDINWPFKASRANFQKRVKSEKEDDKGILVETPESLAVKKAQQATKREANKSDSLLGRRNSTYTIDLARYEDVLLQSSPIIR